MYKLCKWIYIPKLDLQEKDRRKKNKLIEDDWPTLFKNARDFVLHVIDVKESVTSLRNMRCL